MNLFIFALLLTSSNVFFNPEVLGQNCRFGILQRRDWRALSVTERRSYLNGLKQTQSRINNAFSYYDRLAAVHWDFGQSGIHNFAQFLPWHRYYIFTLENEIQRLTNSNITLPYWNWGRDSQAPTSSPIWGSDSASFGFATINNNCVTSGAFANFRTVYPQSDCLRRSWNGGALYSTTWINSLVSQVRRYDDFRSQIEDQPHALVHIAIGGNMRDFSSPNDPVFYLHHTNVDRIWNQWQRTFSSLQVYGGRYRNRDGSIRTADLSDTLHGYRVRVSDVLNVTRLCYSYANPVSFSSSKVNIPEDEIASLVRELEGTISDKEGISSPRTVALSNLFDIQIPAPIPDDWIELNQKDKARIRKLEDNARAEIMRINQESIKSLPSEVIWKNDDLLKGQLETSENGNFTVTVGNFEFDVKLRRKKDFEVDLDDFRLNVYDTLKALRKALHSQ